MNCPDRWAWRRHHASPLLSSATGTRSRPGGFFVPCRVEGWVAPRAFPSVTALPIRLSSVVRRLHAILPRVSRWSRSFLLAVMAMLSTSCSGDQPGSAGQTKTGALQQTNDESSPSQREGTAPAMQSSQSAQNPAKPTALSKPTTCRIHIGAGEAPNRYGHGLEPSFGDQRPPCNDFLATPEGFGSFLCNTPCKREQAKKRRRKNGGKPDCPHSHPLEQEGCGLGRNVILGVVSAQRQALVACYESELQSRPGAKVGLLVKWMIAGDGRVTSAEAKPGTSGSDGFVACVLSAIERLKFPSTADSKPVTVRYPFTFRRFCEPCNSGPSLGPR